MKDAVIGTILILWVGSSVALAVSAWRNRAWNRLLTQLVTLTCVVGILVIIVANAKV